MQKRAAMQFFAGRLGEKSDLMPSSVFVKNAEILGGVPVFAGTRVPAQALFDYLEGGQTLDQFLEDFPTVSRQAAIAALEEGKALILAQLLQ